MSDATEPALGADTSEPVEAVDATEAPEGSGEPEAPENPETPDEAGAPDDAPAREADEVLLGAVALAQRALLEVTAPETVGSVIGHVVEDEHVLSLHFAADLSGYPGWHWSVTLSRVEDGEPTVLETELMPGERALLAPDWVPWSERLADYRAAQAAAAAEAAARGDDVVGADGLDEDDGSGETDVTDESDDEGFADESDDTDDDDVFDGIDIDALAEDGDHPDEGADEASDDADEDPAD